MLAELTHRCPLQCPYCSNPIELDRRSVELDTEIWKRVFGEAAALGVLQVHLSGGEPTARQDLAELVRHCFDAGLYTNLITAGIGLARDRLQALAEAGLDHVQLSIQGADAATCDYVAGLKGAFERKLAAAADIRSIGLPLTLNAVVHRANIEQIPALIDLAVRLGAARVEIAHAQYYGWALLNRSALMPSRDQVARATLAVAEARERLKGTLVIDAVIPDYYARFPKPCMNGWARQSLNVTPSGKVLPCHAAETIPGLTFWNVRERSLAEIWYESPAFNAFRGTAWMPQPCRSCDRREIDWGGCRCQALAITGDASATDPACHLSSFHRQLLALADSEALAQAAQYQYRRYATSAAGHPERPGKPGGAGSDPKVEMVSRR
jgi:pyrroloquinoline quinone biosynthesis protein E